MGRHQCEFPDGRVHHRVDVPLPLSLIDFGHCALLCSASTLTGRRDFPFTIGRDSPSCWPFSDGGKLVS
jgi:hypothetical protein